jgi:hypothetical protein
MPQWRGNLTVDVKEMRLGPEIDLGEIGSKFSQVGRVETYCALASNVFGASLQIH